ncbi:hypothetical protein [Marinobacter caseinilyticus]|uniref:hypothetical protein n=1 Tax=Marinobacter caseinilyticus TaxID=2692195 RepID=UPI00140E5094|nr:hypothetical protein [Marinobacter caseinilyticus]
MVNHTGCFCRRFCQALLLATTFAAGSASALAPEHETRRLMLATEQAVAAEKWGEAGEYLNRLQNLKSEKPGEYLYYRGRVMLESDHLNEAQSALENYIQQTGEKGQHYNDALKLITDVEKKQRAASKRAEQTNREEPVAVIEPAGGEPLARLQQLYLVNSPTEALTVHLNNLLELNGWREDQRIVRTGSAPDIRYRISVESGQVNIQESRKTDDGQVRLSNQSLPVYGVSPSVRWECVASDHSCWVYDPRDESRLFRLGNSQKKTAEAAETFGRLIKSLQSPN